MSILSGPSNLYILIAGAVAVSLAAAAISGVFARGSISGPPRLGENESPRILATITGMGVLAFLMAQIFLAAVFSLWFQRNHPGQAHPKNFSDPEKIMLGSFAQMATFVVLLVLSALCRRQGLKRLGLEPSRIPAAFWRALLGMIILMPFIFLAANGSELFWNALHWHHSENDLLDIFKNSGARWVRVMVVLSAAVIAPLAEETFFRGYLQTALRYSMKRRWPAVLVASACFAAMHYIAWWSIPAIFVLAVGLGYIYERWGNLWACILLHAMFNSTELLLFYYQIHHH